MTDELHAPPRPATNTMTPLATPGLTTPTLPKPGSAEDLGIDREFVVGLARIPLIAVLWTVAAWVASAAVAQFGWYVTIDGIPHNPGPLAVICAGMLVAAFIDGYAFKVPNWCTLSLVLSGWYVGILHAIGIDAIPGFAPDAVGGLPAALAGTAVGFLFLFPALFVGGMGQGDVKMTMGFGSWLGAYFGTALGLELLWWSFAIGVLIGGVFGLVIMATRRKFGTNAQNFREIVTDLQVLVTAGPGKASERANSRRKDWWRLPYGVPLCAGFLGTLWYYLFVGN
jgi:prepilin peptidase CpaA